MADELNTPTHRWYQPRNNIKLPNTDFSRDTIFDSGIQKIDAWINSQPWGNPIPALFAASEPGVWYDPSDISTLFQNSAGTIPVTAAGQPVGLMLDKSRSYASIFGPNVALNSNFATDTVWVKGTGVTIGSGVCTFTSAVSGITVYQTGAVIGKVYRVSFTVVSCAAGGFKSPRGTVVGSTPGTYTDTFLALATNDFSIRANGTTTGEITNVTFEELLGNHATVSAAASRPIYRIDGSNRPYLEFDGVDDFLVTPTITPNIDKAQVFAGVRKLSDASPGILVESSAAVGANNGSFNVAAPENVMILYSTLSHGTATRRSALWANNFIGAAPDTAVISAILDISGDLARIRRNGVNGTDATGDQGTGNFLAYPIFIGRRGGTTFPLNGRLYGLIVRFGANLDANTITNTETWVNSKTGAY